MDEKLEMYRKKKSREQFKKKIKGMIANFFLKMLNFFFLIIRVSDDVSAIEPNSSTQTGDSDNYSMFKFINLKNVFITIIWLVLYVCFIRLEFGAVYFCTSTLFFIYYNTRTGRRDRNEISAYSVFNRNCERIDGTFSAEQFEKQLRTGMY